MSEFLGNNNPFYFEKDIKLLNGDILSLRNAITADAETVVNFFKVTSDESDNLSFSSDEYFVTPYEEKIVISNINRNSKTIMILGFIDEVLCCIAELNSSAELRLSHNVEYSITVLKEFWGIGIGNAITKEIIEFAEEKNIKNIVLSVSRENSAAICPAHAYAGNTVHMLSLPKRCHAIHDQKSGNQTHSAERGAFRQSFARQKILLLCRPR